MDVAVVIPLFNKAPYVRRAVHSVLEQTEPFKELIVVDDGSTDGGGEAAAAVGDPRVRVLSGANQGVSAARNRGIEAASSEWVGLLDADDEWHRDFLRNCQEAVRRWPEAVAVFTNFRRDGNDRPRLRSKDRTRPVLLDNYFRFALENRGFGMTASSVVIRRDVLRKVGAFPVGMVRGEDIDTWSRVAWAGPVVYVPQVLATYYRTPGAVTQMTAHLPERPTNPWLRKRWPADDQVPVELRDAGNALFRYQLRWYAGLLIEAGEKRLARQVLLEDCSPEPYRFEYVFMVIHTFLPV